MTMIEILNKENKLHEENLKKIHFFLENGGWWRAYEFSAFLCNFVQRDFDETNQLKVTKKNLKNYGEYVFVGLKLQSFEKYFPHLNIDNVLEAINENHVIIDISEILVKFSNDDLINKYNEWKNNIVLHHKENIINENKVKKNQENVVTIKSNTIFGILQQVLGYPLDDKTP